METLADKKDTITQNLLKKSLKKLIMNAQRPFKHISNKIIF